MKSQLSKAIIRTLKRALQLPVETRESGVGALRRWSVSLHRLEATKKWRHTFLATCSSWSERERQHAEDTPDRTAIGPCPRLGHLPTQPAGITGRIVDESTWPVPAEIIFPAFASWAAACLAGFASFLFSVWWQLRWYSFYSPLNVTVQGKPDHDLRNKRAGRVSGTANWSEAQTLFWGRRAAVKRCDLGVMIVHSQVSLAWKCFLNVNILPAT